MLEGTDQLQPIFYTPDSCLVAENESDKLLLAAKRIRRATGTDFVISLVADDFSWACSTYVGKLRSNFFGTKFTMYDSQPPVLAASQPNNQSNRRFHAKQVSPRMSACNYTIGAISYELNVLRTRGPRRMHCVMHSIPASCIQQGRSAPTPTSFTSCFDDHHPPLPGSKGKEPDTDFSSTSISGAPVQELGESLVLKNKAPRWHEQLQCWCLNFRGRVTVASVKNFQLVADVDPALNMSVEEQEKIILQFGKIGKDIFTMDYRYPLSTFQAFVICLSSFDTKPACE
ncbi:tubby-like F-box protein 5 isoform X2 [Momordica charantia]|uniref:Tubby-like F-box protein 5 isoform X2 n=1 Tax=Momordica charantia TaxID=3673 RepID=A0A6J1BVP8_MOMCH|nr:tubby-like F-box protein 5 isoform X2 [Momordica charantia]